MVEIVLAALLCLQTNAGDSDIGFFAKSVLFVHAYGEPEACKPKNDRTVKSALAKSLAGDRQISTDELVSLIDKQIFMSIAGDDQMISESEIAQALTKVAPESRRKLNSNLKLHAEFLTTSFDMIEPTHYEAIEQLAEWVAKNYRKDQQLHVITTCTGNSRRSILSAMMGNLAAAYYGLDNLHFYSGGTKPTAFNKRTIATLKEIGFQIEPTGKEAVRGEPQTANPIYRVAWGSDLESLEFSKAYYDSSNPQANFAAILVCSDADADCPTIPGASARISMMFIDPKVYDDGAFEQKKYAERRDDIGRTFLAAMAIARRKVDTALAIE